MLWRIVGLLAVVATLSGCVPSRLSPSEEPARQSTPVQVHTLPSTPTLPAAVPPSDCPHVPLGGFGEVWRNKQVWPRLGCAVAAAEPVTGSEAYLCCMHSIWLKEKRRFVTVQDSGRRWTFVADESGLPPDAPLMVEVVPRSELCVEATGRHGWLARSPFWAEACEGLSRTDETAFEGVMQEFEGG